MKLAKTLLFACLPYSLSPALNPAGTGGSTYRVLSKYKPISPIPSQHRSMLQAMPEKPNLLLSEIKNLIDNAQENAQEQGADSRNDRSIKPHQATNLETATGSEPEIPEPESPEPESPEPESPEPESIVTSLLYLYYSTVTPLLYLYYSMAILSITGSMICFVAAKLWSNVNQGRDEEPLIDLLTAAFSDDLYHAEEASIKKAIQSTQRILPKPNAAAAA